LTEYTSPNEYVEEVKRRIKWNRAKHIATRELSGHINDQYDAFCKMGISNAEAMRKAIAEMGSADIVGNELNAVHKPKTNWLLIGIVALLFIAGFVISAVTQIELTRMHYLAIGVGMIAATILYYVDYTVLIRYPRVIYWILTLATLVSFLYEARNGIHYIGYSYTFYLLLIYPLVTVGIAFQIGTKKTEINLIKYLLYCLFPLVLSAVLASLPAMLVLIVSNIVIAVYGLRNKWLVPNRFNIIGGISIAAIIFLFMIWLGLFVQYKHFTLNRSHDYFNAVWNDLIDYIPFVGSSGSTIPTQNFLVEHPFLNIVTQFGWVSMVLIAVVFYLFGYLLYKVCKKQNTSIGYLLSLVVFIILSVQFFTSMVCDAGLLTDASMSIPFLASGGTFTAYNFGLIGIILSVSRNEDIAKDWIKFKEREKEKQ